VVEGPVGGGDVVAVVVEGGEVLEVVGGVSVTGRFTEPLPAGAVAETWMLRTTKEADGSRNP
jgi:hypothetical protein